MRFLHPEPLRRHHHIYPVFIPFAGCKTRCIFCAQDLQTGQGAKKYADIVRQVEAHFAQTEHKQPLELAYYGGTFTALPEEEQLGYLELAARLKAEGKIRRLRCSTRPDAINPNQLKKLRKFGLDCIELGVQSFCTAPLTASRRGYSGATAYKACQMVQESGISLGVQLLPGLPGQTARHFTEDIRLCLELKPDMVRLYPCLVLRGTAMAECWKLGQYKPWSLEETLERLSPAILSLWEHGIRTIRMGLAPEEGLRENILDGPFHYAMGQCLRSRALFLFMKNMLASVNQSGFTQSKILYAPKCVQGEFFGHKGDLKDCYTNIGLDVHNVKWWSHEYFELLAADEPAAI